MIHVIPIGKYYLVDARFMLRSTLLAPYKGVRYHLKSIQEIHHKILKSYSTLDMHPYAMQLKEHLES